MAINGVVVETELGTDFVPGSVAPNVDKWVLNLGPGLTRNAEGKIEVELDVTSSPLFQYETIWAEENGGLSVNNSGFEFSYGNGSVGNNVGIPMGGGWQLLELFYNADVHAASASVTLGLFSATPTLVTTGASISVNGATDGFGGVNNTSKVDVLATPLAMPADFTPVFRTLAVSGTITDVRVGARFRRQVGTVVTGISLPTP